VGHPLDAATTAAEGGMSMSVYCAAVNCKYHSDTNRCTAKRITLSSHSILTLWNGRQDFWKCKQYEMSDEYKAVFEQIGQAEEGE